MSSVIQEFLWIQKLILFKWCVTPMIVQAELSDGVHGNMILSDFGIILG